MKISYEIPDDKVAKMDIRAKKMGCKVTDYAAFKKDYVRESMFLIIVFVVYAFIGGVSGYQLAKEGVMSDCMGNAVKENTLTINSTVSDVVKVCGWTNGLTKDAVQNYFVKGGLK